LVRQCVERRERQVAKKGVRTQSDTC
jgi:hypothetical protein